MQDDLKVNRRVLSVIGLHDSSDDDAYWQTRTPEERLRAIQINRQAAYGKSNATGRLQRILEVVKRPCR
jgi:hypothetical protein